MLIGSALSSIGTELRKLFPKAQRVFIVSVAHVREMHGNIPAESLKVAGFQCQFIEMPDGERYKTLATVEGISAKLVNAGADRNSLIVALGGGVVGDVAGFAASIYMRGIPVVQVPTTLLAHLDSSVGGKTGVNLKEGKNLIGTFHQPRLVIMDPSVLKTLPEREFRSGLFEALKAGVIYNAALFDYMEKERERILGRDTDALEYVISESVKVKAEVVAADEREQGLRKILNFGHTIGHALESETKYKHFLHGEAVAWGMIAATMIAVGMQRIDSAEAQRVIAAVLAYAQLPNVDVRPKNILKRLASDKKAVNGQVQFVLPTTIGTVEIESHVPDKAVLQAVEELKTLSASS